jgi:hypothetical protein
METTEPRMGVLLAIPWLMQNPLFNELNPNLCSNMVQAFTRRMIQGEPDQIREISGYEKSNFTSRKAVISHFSLVG